MLSTSEQIHPCEGEVSLTLVSKAIPITVSHHTLIGVASTVFS